MTAPQTTPEQESNSLWEGLSLAWELGYLIAIPAIAFSFTGAYMDKTFGTSPLYLLSGIAIGMLLSGLAVYRKTKHIINDWHPRKDPPKK